MKLRLAGAWAACFALLLGTVAGVSYALHASFGPEERETFGRLLSASDNLLFILAVAIFVTSGFIANWLTRTYLAPARRLSASTRLIASGNAAHRIDVDGPAELRELAGAINALATKHEETVTDVDARIARARFDLDQEKNRLAALMSELAQSVVVCNVDGRILLYNERARRMFTALESDSAPVASYIGLGRSLFALLDRELIFHALEQLRDRLAHGEAGPVTAFMAATRTGQLVRAQMAPVASADEGEAASGPLAGFVLLAEDMGEEVTRIEQRDQLLQHLIEAVRASLGSVRAAVENLTHYPAMDAARREQFIGIINQEADRLTVEIERTTQEYSRHVKSQWLLDRIRVGDLIEVIRHRLESRMGLSIQVAPIDRSWWMSVDSFNMVQAVSYLARRLKEERGVTAICFAAAAVGRYARIDMTWTGAHLPASTVLAWEDGALTSGLGTGALTFRDVLDRHHGEAWYEADRTSQRSGFRLLLPLARPGGSAPAATAPLGRPEYYDFDLFRQPRQTRGLEDRPLKDLTCTAFDTETTGLEPSAGDEIISIGAVRIVNGRLLAAEVFDQLVDPRRALDSASVKIHGIQPHTLDGKPTIDIVLPAFHKFCEDTVLIGHNAAFDMRFLQLKEKATGVRFTQPVLDTLLLSAVLYENLESHELDAIAGRFGVDVINRHTALGDAVITGKVFLRMIPVLAERGIVTLEQALDACERTYYARVKY